MGIIIDANLLVALVTQHPQGQAAYQQFERWADQAVASLGRTSVSDAAIDRVDQETKPGFNQKSSLCARSLGRTPVSFAGFWAF